MEKQEANNQIGIQTVSLLSDFLCQSKVVSRWQRGRQVSQDFPLHRNTLQPLPSDPNEFPGHMKYKTPPTSSGSSLGLDVLWRSPMGGIQIRSLEEVSQLDPWSPSTATFQQKGPVSPHRATSEAETQQLIPSGPKLMVNPEAYLYHNDVVQWLHFWWNLTGHQLILAMASDLEVRLLISGLIYKTRDPLCPKPIVKLFSKSIQRGQWLRGIWVEFYLFLPLKVVIWVFLGCKNDAKQKSLQVFGQ